MSDHAPARVCFGHPPAFEIPDALCADDRAGENHLGVRFGDRAVTHQGRGPAVDGVIDKWAFETWLGPDGWSAGYADSHGMRYLCLACRLPIAHVKFGNVTLVLPPIPVPRDPAP